MKADGIALAILGGVNNSLCDDLTHGTRRPKISKRFASFVESLAHRRDSSVVEPNVFDWTDIHRDLPYERERSSVSQSPRPEAVSVIEQAIPAEGMRTVQYRPLSYLSPPLFVTRTSLGLAPQAYYFEPTRSHRFESKADKADFVEICFVPPAM
jgi:hypothetical protein